MKVLVAGHTYSPLDLYSFKGGVETFTVNTYKAFDTHPDITAYLSGPSDSTIDGEFWVPWPVISKWQHLRENRPSKFNPAENLNSYIEALRALNLDLIVTSTGSVKVLRAMAQLGIPVIYVSHSYIIWKYDLNFYEYLKDIKAKHSNFKIFAVTQFVMDNINGNMPGIIDDNFIPGYLEIPLNYQLSVAESHLPADLDSRGYFLYTGRLSRDKEIGTLIDAFEKTPHHQLLLIGEPSIFPEAEKTWWNDIEKRIHNSTNILCIPESQPHQVIFEYLKNAKGFISPAPGEAFSYSIFEAQLMGVPVIYHKKQKCGVDEFVISGKTGISIESYRVRHTEVVRRFSDALDQIHNFFHNDMREFTQAHFREKYTAQRFISDFLFKVGLATQG